MPDLSIRIGADITNYATNVTTASKMAVDEFGNKIPRALKATSAAMAETAAVTGGAAQSMSMRFMQMRSGLSAVRDGAMGAFVGGQRADMMFMAMGHHFTSLINETGSLKGAFSALGASVIGPGGIIIGLTLAYEIFKHFSKGAKEAKDTLKNYEDQLDAVTSATLKGEIAGRQETTRLQILYNATQNHTLSLRDRNLAYDELEKKYPAWFTNAEREKTLLGDNKKKYDELVASILAAAYAKAYETRIGENAARDIENQQKVLDQLKKQKELKKQIAKDDADPMSDRNLTSARTGGGDIKQSTESEDELAKSIKIVNDLKTDSKLLNQQNLALQDKALQKEKEANFETEHGITGRLKKQKDGFAALEQAIGLIKKKLEDAIISHQPTVARQLAIDLEKAEEKLQILKKEYENSLLAGNGAAKLTIRDTKNISTPDLSSPTGDAVAADIAAHIKLQNEIMASQAAGRAWKAELKDENSIIKEMAHSIGVGLTHAFESAMNGTQSFVQAMGQFLLQLVEKLIAAAAAAAVLAVLLDATGYGEAMGAGASFGSLFGQLSGLGSLTGSSIPQHASGGIFTSPRIGMFAEAGPEAIVTPKHLADFAGVQHGGMTDGTIVGVLRGSDLLLQFNRANKSQSRKS